MVQAECEAKEGEDRATWYRADATSFEALPDGSDVLRVLNLRYPEAASQKEAQQYVAAISALALQLRGGASLPEAASTQKLGRSMRVELPQRLPSKENAGS